MSFKDVKIGPEAPQIVRVIVEIPKGSRNKYEVDLESNTVTLNRVLYSPLAYPYDYGHIPETLSQDGDNLDILVISDEGTFPGCVVEARTVGALDMEDEKGRDEKILAVSAHDPRYLEVNDLDDLPRHRLMEIEHFFNVYKTLEDKRVNVFGWKKAEEAKRMICAAYESYCGRKLSKKTMEGKEKDEKD